MRLVVIERIGPVPAPRIGLAGSEAFNRPPAIDLKFTQEGQALDAGPDVFVPFPNNQGNPFGPTLIPVGPKHHGCGKKKNIVMAKMDDVSRFFRKLMGFAPIEEFTLPLPVPDHAAERHNERPAHKMMAAHTGLDEDNEFHILPFMPGPVQSEAFPPPLPGSEVVSTPHFSPGRPEENPPIYILTLFSFFLLLFLLPITAFQSPTSVLRARFEIFADGSLLRLNSEAIIECGFTVTAHTRSSAASTRLSSPSRHGKAARSRL